MISKFGKCIRNIREQEKDSLRQMAIKLGISAAFLSAMEVGRKQIPLEYVEKIKVIYNLTEEQEVELGNSIYETNKSHKLTTEYLDRYGRPCTKRDDQHHLAPLDRDCSKGAYKR